MKGFGLSYLIRDTALGFYLHHGKPSDTAETFLGALPVELHQRHLPASPVPHGLTTFLPAVGRAVPRRAILRSV